MRIFLPPLPVGEGEGHLLRFFNRDAQGRQRLAQFRPGPDVPPLVEECGSPGGDFVRIGVQAKAPHNCGVVSWNGTMYINMIRNIREPELESHFYRVLHTLGLPVKVESNQRWT